MALIDGTNRADTLQGTNEDDIINGFSGADSIDALGGNDRLVSGSGSDTLTGGSGADVFVLEQFATSVDDVDAITDFSQGQDKIDLRDIGIGQFETVFALLSNNAEGNVVITTELSSGLSTTEIEGIGQTQLSASDFIFNSSTADDDVIGTNRRDTLFGGLGNNTLSGDQGSDRIFGEAGNDRFISGSGSDTLIGGSGSDVFVLEQFATSVDDVDTIADFVQGEDRIDLRGIGIGQFETALALLANNAEGNAVITTELSSGLSITEIERISQTQLSASDFIFDSSTADDDVIGTNRRDTLFGGLGNNTLSGDQGSDRIFGEAGNDRFISGSGSDTLIGGSGADVFVLEQFATSVDDVDTITDFVQGEDRIDLRGLGISQFETVLALLANNPEGNAVITTELSSGLSTTEIEGISQTQLSATDFIFDSSTTSDDVIGTNRRDDLFGGLGNDTLSGDQGNDQLFGEAGDDRLIGGRNDDTLIGGAGTDTAVFSGAFSEYEISTDNGTVTVRNTSNNGDGTDVLTGIERIEFGDRTIDLVDTTNNAPEANNDVATTDEDVVVSINVLANDTDSDGDTLSVESVTQGSNGSVTVNTDGTVSYTPDADFSGSDSFTYAVSDGELSDTGTVTVTVEPVIVAPTNDAPIATDDTATTDENVAVSISVLANDSDANGDALSTESVTQGENGSVTINANGTVSYTPDANFSGSDSFTYTVSDGELSDTGTVTVTVDPVIVVPTNDAPIATDDTAMTDEGVAVSVDVLTNDSDADGDALSVESVTQGNNGSVTINANGTVSYTPDANFSGSDSFTYAVSDGELSDTGTVTVTVEPVITPQTNDAPIATDDTATTDENVAVSINVLANDSDADGDALSIENVTQGENGSVAINTDGTVSYTPDANFSGSDSFTYAVSDGELSDTGTVTVMVEPVIVAPTNDAPIATDDIATTNEDTAVSINVLSNDSDANDDELSVESITQGNNGSVTINTDGSVSYTPDANFNGSDSFTYTVSDGDLSDTGTVTVTVQPDVDPPANDAPIATDDSFSGDADSSISGNVLANDSDPNGDALSSTLLTNVSNGELSLDTDGSFVYTPNAGFSGDDSFTYTVSDGNLTDTATVSFSVVPEIVVEPVIEVQQLVDANGDGLFTLSETGTAGENALFQTEITNAGTVAVTLTEIVDSAFSIAGSSLATLVGTTLAVGESVMGTYQATLPTTVATTVGTDSSDTLSGQQTTELGQIMVTASSAISSEATASAMASVDVDLNDIIAGNLGDDIILGGGGDDVLRGDRNARATQDNEPGGDDIIFGGSGSDRIGGKSGNDILLGDSGNDFIWGDDGDDILFGGSGNDVLVGDNMSGGSGSDLFVFGTGTGTDTLLDFEVGIDRIGLIEGELTFAAITITQDGSAALLGVASSGDTLAVLNNVQASALTESSFELTAGVSTVEDALALM